MKNLSTKKRIVQNAVLLDTVKSRLNDAATSTVPEVLSRLGSRLTGLSENEVREQVHHFGKNAITKGKKKSLGRRIAEAFINPFTAILIALALVSAATDMVFPALSLLGNTPEDFDPLTVIIILTMVVLSGTLRFVQESRSGNAAEKLLAMITITCTVTRRNQPKIELPLDEVVPGDIIHLSSGDMVPCDVRILEAKDFFVNESSLTGESEGVEDEKDMVLLGYLAFLDPPKESTAEAIRALKNHGVETKILTGDNEKVTRTICRQVGLKVNSMILGSQLENMSDEELSRVVEKTQVFAKLTPDQKARVVTCLRQNGHTVGFMGDGINDAQAMKVSDVGISVDSTVDIAKESADIILLEKDLMVLEEGIVEGRKTDANMIKYIKMTASSNFGNMFSVLAASALLPFLPMMSVHLIFLNLIYDLSCTAIPWDNVDEEFLAIPRKWDASSVGNFMIWIGPTSSIFDFTTYIFMYFVFCPLFVSNGVLFNDLANHFAGSELEMMQFKYAAMFQAGWFIESMWSQTLIIHMIRTPKLPFIQSRASLPLTLLTFTGIAVLTVIPFTPFGTMLGFAALPASYFAYLVSCILLYMMLATSLKKAYVRHYGELL
ncbi:MAG: HAD-IC family P-type ATPase [Spirochaetales bacterium]|nr:HAD-IC family P-type ATPase [Spirochaetales bacterium]